MPVWMWVGFLVVVFSEWVRQYVSLHFESRFVLSVVVLFVLLGQKEEF